MIKLHIRPITEHHCSTHPTSPLFLYVEPTNHRIYLDCFHYKMRADNITTHEFEVVEGLERTCSVISLLGCFFIIITFLTTTAFRKPINRLVFYASIGNLFTNMGTLISRSALSKPNSHLCQFQAFLIQM